MREQILGLTRSARTKDDEAALIARAYHDPNAFAVLYQHHVNAVYRYCYSRTGNRADAEDLTAQVFVDVWQSLPRYRHRGTFRAWVFTIAHRRVVDHYRSRERNPIEPAVDFDETRDDGRTYEDRSPLGRLIHKETLSKLIDLVANLDEDRQAMLSLRYAGDLTYREIGQVVGKSTAAVKMTIRRTLKHLATTWGDDHD